MSRESLIKAVRSMFLTNNFERTNHYAKRLAHYLIIAMRGGTHVDFRSLFEKVFGISEVEMEELLHDISRGGLSLELNKRLRKVGLAIGETDY